MYKRKMNQVSMFDNPAMFGGIALNPENEWVKLAKIMPLRVPGEPFDTLGRHIFAVDVQSFT